MGSRHHETPDGAEGVGGHSARNRPELRHLSMQHPGYADAAALIEHAVDAIKRSRGSTTAFLVPSSSPARSRGLMRFACPGHPRTQGLELHARELLSSYLRRRSFAAFTSFLT